MERVKRDKPARLRTLYDTEVREKLMAEFSLANRMQAPKLTRITINMGLGEAVTNPKLLDSAVDELGAITGQRPVVTRAKKSIAIFKLRAGQKIGAMVTLRRDQMYEFFDRLVSFALPRVRDFKGVSPKSFDGRGNYTMGIREEIIFPEINFEKLDKPKGMNITFNTTAPNDEQGRALLKHLGMPFRN
jgi:large subunit ribosomal protein L5